PRVVVAARDDGGPPDPRRLPGTGRDPPDGDGATRRIAARRSGGPGQLRRVARRSGGLLMVSVPLGTPARAHLSPIVVARRAAVVWAVAVAVAVVAGASADVIAAIVVAPVLFLLTLPAILGEARRQANATVGWVLGAGVAVKLVGALLRYAVAFGMYGGRSDAATYGASGSSIAHGIWAGTIHLGGHLSGTGLIELFTGVSYAVTGSSLLASYLVFAWVGFWGRYLSYRAFAIAVPEGRLRDYAL